MILNVLLILGLFFAIYRVTSHVFRFEKLTRLTSVIIPVYSLVMFLVVMDWNLSNVTMLFGLTLVSVPIAWFQVSKVEFKRSNDADRYGRTTIYVKKGLPYLWGWLITILLGIGCSALFETLTPNLVLKEIFSELKNELLTFSIFTQHSDWYIWFLSGATSSLYTRFLKIKEPAVINALKRK